MSNHPSNPFSVGRKTTGPILDLYQPSMVGRLSLGVSLDSGHDPDMGWGMRFLLSLAVKIQPRKNGPVVLERGLLLGWWDAPADDLDARRERVRHIEEEVAAAQQRWRDRAGE
jgi:hypothetical protein